MIKPTEIDNIKEIGFHKQAILAISFFNGLLELKYIQFGWKKIWREYHDKKTLSIYI